MRWYTDPEEKERFGSRDTTPTTIKTPGGSIYHRFRVCQITFVFVMIVTIIIINWRTKTTRRLQIDDAQ